MRLIDEDALIEDLHKKSSYDLDCFDIELLGVINEQPTIEAVPVVHGHNNNQNYHEVDEFRCSVCGLHLEGWERHVYDEDRDDEFIKEYAFKYCPECGAKIGGAE